MMFSDDDVDGYGDGDGGGDEAADIEGLAVCAELCTLSLESNN
jgi:hypothetical protein